MHICHVSPPHLPPDQAANALLPAQLGAWIAARGAEVRFVTQPPTQGRALVGELPGQVWRVRPRSGSGLSRRHLVRRSRSITRARSSRPRARRTCCICTATDSSSRVAAAWADWHGLPYVLTLYGTEIRHYRPRWPMDPFTRAYRGAKAVTFYSQGLLDKARALGLD